MSFCLLPYGFYVVKLTLCYQSMVFTYVIINPIQVYLISWVAFFKGIMTIVVVNICYH
jgi:hypothetical protein